MTRELGSSPDLSWAKSAEPPSRRHCCYYSYSLHLNNQKRQLRLGQKQTHLFRTDIVLVVSQYRIFRGHCINLRTLWGLLIAFAIDPILNSNVSHVLLTVLSQVNSPNPCFVLFIQLMGYLFIFVLEVWTGRHKVILASKWKGHLHWASDEKSRGLWQRHPSHHGGSRTQYLWNYWGCA